MNHIKPFWDDEYKNLNYRKEVFNDEYAIEKWRKKGYDNDINSFSGEMANYSDKQPDAYNVYTEKFGCKTEDVHKILVFLEDWKSGHYFELEGKPFVEWSAGNYATWVGNTEHFAANIGTEYRYTLQITGHK